MAKRKKRNAVTLVSLLLALVALISVYVWYSNRDTTTEDPKASQEEKTLSLAVLDKQQVNEIHYIHEDADITLVLENNVWKSKNDPNRPIDQAKATDLINVIDEIKAVRVVNEAPQDLSEYGLEEPGSYIRATQKGGAEVTLQIGDETSGTGYYALVNDDKKVYLVETTYGSGLQYKDIELTAVEESPAITAENIHHIDIDFRDKADFELLYDKDNVIDKTYSDLYSWVILKPYEEGYTADGSKVSELLPNYSSIDFKTCVDYNSEDLSKYGLEKAIATIYVGYYETYTQTLDKPETNPETGEEITEKTYYDEKDIKLFIGNQDEAGNYYVRKEGSNAVYTMDAATVDKMLQVNPFNIINPYVCIPNIENVDRIDAQIDGKPYTMEIKRTTAENDKGEEEKKATYFYNGQEVTEEVFKDVYQVIITAKYDAEIKKDISIEGTKPYLVISYHIQGDRDEIVTAAYLPYDDSFYLVDTGNGPRFLADKRKIDKIAQTITEFKKTQE